MKRVQKNFVDFFQNLRFCEKICEFARKNNTSIRKNALKKAFPCSLLLREKSTEGAREFFGFFDNPVLVFVGIEVGFATKTSRRLIQLERTGTAATATWKRGWVRCGLVC